MNGIVKSVVEVKKDGQVMIVNNACRMNEWLDHWTCWFLVVKHFFIFSSFLFFIVFILCFFDFYFVGLVSVDNKYLKQ